MVELFGKYQIPPSQTKPATPVQNLLSPSPSLKKPATPVQSPPSPSPSQTTPATPVKSPPHSLQTKPVVPVQKKEVAQKKKVQKKERVIIVKISYKF